MSFPPKDLTYLPVRCAVLIYCSEHFGQAVETVLLNKTCVWLHGCQSMSGKNQWFVKYISTKFEVSAVIRKVSECKNAVRLSVLS